MAGIAPGTFWSKGYALTPSATRTIDMTLPSFIHSFVHSFTPTIAQSITVLARKLNKYYC